jgi:hypothetical protein
MLVNTDWIVIGDNEADNLENEITQAERSNKEPVDDFTC